VAAEFEREVRGGVVRWGGRYIPVSTKRSMDVVLRQAISGDVAWA
jgi:hypothetical protein